MHECVLVACAGDDNATEKSESSTRSLMQPTMPFAYLPPVVLTMSGAPPWRRSKFDPWIVIRGADDSIDSTDGNAQVLKSRCLVARQQDMADVEIVDRVVGRECITWMTTEGINEVYIFVAYQRKDRCRCSIASVVPEKMLRHRYHCLPRETPIARFWEQVNVCSTLRDPLGT